MYIYSALKVWSLYKPDCLLLQKGASNDRYHETSNGMNAQLCNKQSGIYKA